MSEHQSFVLSPRNHRAEMLVYRINSRRSRVVGKAALNLASLDEVNQHLSACLPACRSVGQSVSQSAKPSPAYTLILSLHFEHSMEESFGEIETCMHCACI